MSRVAILNTEFQLPVGLIARLGLPVMSEPSGNYEFYLVMRQDGLELCEAGSLKPGHGLRIDFFDGPMTALRKSARVKDQPLAKAIGISREKPVVFDATAGLLKDSFFLACLGCAVLSVERSPVVFELGLDALLRGPKDLPGSIELVSGDSLQVLRNLEPTSYPDVVYIDPMYPESKKSALPKKSMQLFRKLLGPDQDSGDLFKVALERAKKRVVVKRPNEAPPIFGEPSHSYEGKMVRYDMYLTRK